MMTTWKGEGKRRDVSGLRTSPSFLGSPELDNSLPFHKDPPVLATSVQFQIHILPASPTSMGHGIYYLGAQAKDTRF